MNKKEIAEIKKQFTPDNCCITRICGCYVDAEKQRVTELKEAFLSLSEEEMFKYFDIFRKALSGTIGKNLMPMEFPLDQEEEGGTQEFLLRLKRSRLTEDDLVSEFYDKVIESYDHTENYYIILIHGIYDIPGRSSDGTEMFDASDEVYEHLMCCICPVNLTKAGLCYNAAANTIQDRIRDWVVEMPDAAFLFPLFRDRSTDLHGVLYYARQPEKIHADLIGSLLGCEAPLTAGGQKDSFQVLVQETLEEECDYETVVNIHEKLNEWIEAQKEEPDPVVLTKNEVRRLFEESGAPDEKMKTFDEQYELAAGEKQSLTASNLTNPKKMEIRTPSVVISIVPERSDLLTPQIVNGRRCLVIPMDEGVEVNGIPVHPAGQKEA